MNEAMLRAAMNAMGKALEDVLEPGTAFALFVDWRDGRAPSYLSNGNRRDIVKALTEWSVKSGMRAAADVGVSGARGRALSAFATLAEERGAIPPLEARCAEVGKQMVEEGIDVVLFLFTMGDGGETAWWSSWPSGFGLVMAWLDNERRQS